MYQIAEARRTRHDRQSIYNERRRQHLIDNRPSVLVVPALAAIRYGGEISIRRSAV
jgi:hypothetical protein